MSRDPKTLALFTAHRPALVNYASSIVGSRVQAEDLVQEAWLRFDQASRGRFLEDATGYLYRIVRNLALDSRRRMAREGRLTAAADFEAVARTSPDTAPDPETVALYKDEYALVMAAMAELPERTRIACEMHRFGGAKLREIAALLGISVPLAHKLVAEGIEHCKRRRGRR
ncbi:RNA polymerase sigma-70 factor, ECF subfamily [Tistlia consotensis]|uniref:RNA polymerase sigma-70 factor, ECF subfamily n=1 Tax=Tistlia consotensis USBA 355 TaxID=560819 RepID=A0A1Y6CIE3_9PROT|nr:sigma-70 family RNA polymerase sigma factor [Tistlia consotensis]SMF64128.1 RNA polymerase sigma-70 factor, ECF subfamily [Tistlia consotensis USBA 355]SNR97883.1 RNA polymerase sigma-70 factor, ECF subfamily [Tistlia consotensis]